MSLNDVGYIGMIIIFWLVFSVLLTYYVNDISVGELFENSTITSNIDTGSFNASVDNTETLTKPSNFIGMFFRMFTFRVPFLDFGLNLLISLWNWFLMVMFALLMFRQIRSGGG